MRKAARAGAALVLAGGPLLLSLPGVAHADTASITASNAGYFFALGIDKPEASPADPPNLTADHADGVGPGHLGVAAQGGQEDKVSFLYFDMFTLPADITVTRAVVTMKTVPDSLPDDINAQASPEKVAACKAGDEGFSGDEGNGIATAPARLCDKFTAKGAAGTAPGTYQWDITPLVQTWVTGDNDGVAFTRADSAPNTNFQVVFDKPSTATLQLEYTLPAPVLPEQPPAVSTPEIPLLPGVGGVPLPPVDSGLVPSAPLVPGPVVNPPAAPVVQQPTGAVAPVALSTSLRPDNQLWWAAFALGATLLLLSLVLGDPRAAATTRSTSRLSLALAGNKRLAPTGVLQARQL
jgi:hypothetical protein